MVFPGRFSTGCLRCRQRKVKCDEGKPSCRRCAIYGKPCTGYTDQFHFRHSRNKSTAATSKASQTSQIVATQPRQDAKSSSPQSSSPQSSSPQGRRHSTATTSTTTTTHRRQPPHSQQYPNHVTSLVRAPEASYDQASLCYFVSRFVSPDPTDGYPAHLSFLPGLYDGYRSGLLETATLSVAQMAAYNKFGGDKFKVESYQNYGRAIRMLQDTIRLEDQATDDKVIAAILLLCTLKDVSGEESGDPNEHAPGLFYLIEKRGLEQLATSRGSELLYLALIRLQVYAFLHEDDTYVDPGAIATCWGAFDPLLRAMSLMSKTLSLRHQLLSIHPISFSAPADPISPHLDYQTSVIQGCFETLDDFQTWDAEAASHWASMFSGRGAPTVLGQVASVPYYDAETACTIILIRSARLILLMSMIAYINMAEWTPVLEGEVELVINDILACVPHALGEQNPAGLSSVSYDGAAAVMIHQPMRLVASCAYTTPEQLQTANDILARLNAGIGIRAAVGVSSEEMNRTSWAREQTRLRERISVRRLESPAAVTTCPSLSPVEVDMEASPMESESPPLLTPLSLDPPWADVDVGCASY